MTEDIAVQWVAFATRRPVEDVLGLGLSDSQVRALGRWLSENGLLNPPKAKVKRATFVCQCGCGQEFTASYRTNRPKYVNNTHRQRAYRRRKRMRARA